MAVSITDEPYFSGGQNCFRNLGDGRFRETIESRREVCVALLFVCSNKLALAIRLDGREKEGRAAPLCGARIAPRLLVVLVTAR